MNTLQAEKLRDIVALLEKLHAQKIKVNLYDSTDGPRINLEFELWNEKKEAQPSREKVKL